MSTSLAGSQTLLIIRYHEIHDIWVSPVLSLASLCKYREMCILKGVLRKVLLNMYERIRMALEPCLLRTCEPKLGKIAVIQAPIPETSCVQDNGAPVRIHYHL